MFLNDLQSEWAFYGRALDVVGHLYLTPKEQPSRYPDLLFFCLYTCRLLVDRKLTLSAASRIQNQLSLGQGLEKALNWDEDREYTLPARVIEYKGYSKSAISASLLFREKLHFRFGHTGFGFFGNSGQFDFCAEASVFALMETVYKKIAGDGAATAFLWDCAAVLGGEELGPGLSKGNWFKRAKDIYQEVTGDYFPALLK